MERPLVRYRNYMTDSSRWDAFAFREGDIVISAPPKSGTTWTQMICALLIFQTPELREPLDVISPWIDQQNCTLDELFASLDAQQHRRVVKSHTPLDGLPFDEQASYICVGRDPRDVALSIDNQLDNLDLDAFFALRDAAIGTTDDYGAPVDRPPTLRERFWSWVDSSNPLRGLAYTLHHLATFWEVRDRPNVVMLHYDDLQADLDAQMRRLAGFLCIDVPGDAGPGLVHAASFEDMKRRASRVAPNATKSIWRDTARFFHRGTSGQWRDLLNDADLRRYEERVAELAEPDLSNWVHRGQVR